MKKALSLREERFAELIAFGLPPKIAMLDAGYAESTIRHHSAWIAKRTKVKERIEELRTNPEILNKITQDLLTNRLTGLARKAIDTLENLLGSEADWVRRAAACDILRLAERISISGQPIEHKHLHVHMRAFIEKVRGDEDTDAGTTK